MTIKTATFNIRCDTRLDGKNCFSGRKRLIKKFLKRESFDIIGFQEVQPHVKSWLQSNFTEYSFLGTGRLSDFSGEGVPIAYKTDKFDLLNFSQFWLSDTPDVAGSRFEDSDQSKYPRICCIATLVCKESGRIFSFANTHLDHLGVDARKKGAQLIYSELSKKAHPFILTGDFNAFPDSCPIKTFISDNKTKDLTESLGKGFATYHEFGKITDSFKIDYIFAKSISSFSDLKVHTDSKRGIFLSDHYPVSANINI